MHTRAKLIKKIVLHRSCAEWTYVLMQFTNQIMATKHHIMTRSQLEKMDMRNLCKVFCCCKMKYWENRQNYCNKTI